MRKRENIHVFINISDIYFVLTSVQSLISAMCIYLIRNGDINFDTVNDCKTNQKQIKGVNEIIAILQKF